jgi:hypothetical protein
VRNALKFLPLVVALAGCAAQPWSKESATAEQLQTDQRACQDQAYREVAKRYATLTTVAPAVSTDSQARRFGIYPSGLFADQFGTQLQEESRVTRECMLAKGYRQR